MNRNIDTQMKTCEIQKLISETSSFLYQLRVKEVLSDDEIEKIYPNFAASFATIDEFRQATFPQILALSIFRASLLHDHITNVEIATKALAKLERLKQRDFEEKVRPILMLNGIEADV